MINRMPHSWHSSTWPLLLFWLNSTAFPILQTRPNQYRQAQRELIGQGRFQDAQQMDIDDIHEKFGTKYDDAIQQMLDFTKELLPKK
jgi:hypothetical protein